MNEKEKYAELAEKVNLLTEQAIIKYSEVRNEARGALSPFKLQKEKPRCP